MSVQTSGPWTPLELANRLTALPAVDGDSLAMRRAISAAARRFHESQGLLTASALGALQRLEEGAALIRFAHQPNFLPDANLFAQVLYLDRLSDVLRNAGTPAAAVVFFVDHDVAGNERLHVSEVWDPSAPGHIRRFRLPLGPNDDRRKTSKTSTDGSHGGRKFGDLASARSRPTVRLARRIHELPVDVCEP